MANIDDVIKGILNREGGYVNHPNDKGGPTKYGITQDTLAGWRHKPVSALDVMNLSIGEAAQIYKALYVEKPGFLRFDDDALAEQLIDAGVNHGTAEAARLLQEAIGAKVDGVIGPDTIQKAKAMPGWLVYFKFMATRLKYYAHILEQSKKKQVFAAGWMNRCALMVELYIRDGALNQSGRDLLWQTATFLRDKSKIVQETAANRPLAVGWFRDAGQMLMSGASPSVAAAQSHSVP